MKGFFKRDFFLILPNVKFGLGFVALFAVVGYFGNFKTSFVSLYLTIFSMSMVIGLFNYDEANHWQPYAAAAPNGRRDQVTARYLLSLAACAAAAVLSVLCAALDGSWQDAWGIGLLYGGMGILYADILLPVSYRFGSSRSRFIMIAFIAIVAALMGMAVTSMSIAGGPGSASLFTAHLGLFLVAVALAGTGISYVISLRVMAKKEL